MFNKCIIMMHFFSFSIKRVGKAAVFTSTVHMIVSATPGPDASLDVRMGRALHKEDTAFLLHLAPPSGIVERETRAQ